MKKIVFGMTGASGAVYGARLLDLLLRLGAEAHVVMSRTAEATFAHELGIPQVVSDPRGKTYEISPEASREVDQQFFLVNAIAALHRMYKFRDLPRPEGEMPVDPGRMIVHRDDDFFAAIASGSFPSNAMVVCPCSSGSLGCIVSGVNRHLVHRAAEVHLKERRPLILVVRETPLSLIQLENMVAITKSGGTVLPAAPHFYGVSEPHQPLGVADLIDSIAARILDRLHIEHPIQNRWKEGR